MKLPSPIEPPQVVGDFGAWIAMSLWYGVQLAVPLLVGAALVRICWDRLTRRH